MERARSFSREELAFFAVPRRWIPAIVARFGDDSDVRDAIIQVDEDGGASLMRWRAGPGTWELSEKGKRWVGNRLMAKVLRQYPDTRGSVLVAGYDPAVGPDGGALAIMEVGTDGSSRVVDVRLLSEKSPIADIPATSSFLCPACGTKSLGSDRCMACEPPLPENP